MKPVKTLTMHALEIWRCRHCDYTYKEEDYLLPLGKCPRCGQNRPFDRVTQECQYHPGGDLFLLP